MVGLIAQTSECYANNRQNRFYCLYLDLASRKIDQIFVDAMGWPATEFFSDAEFGPRIIPVLVEAGMDMDAANAYLRTVTPVINKLVLERIVGKK